VTPPIFLIPFFIELYSGSENEQEEGAETRKSAGPAVPTEEVKIFTRLNGSIKIRWFFN